MRKKKKQRSEQGKVKIKPDEVFSAGPLTMARFGRFVQMNTRWDPATFQHMRKKMPEIRQKLASDMAEQINECIGIVSACDPLPLLFSIFLKNNLVDVETYSEPEHEGRESYVEYAQSLIMSVPNHGSQPATGEQAERFETLVKSIVDGCMFFFTFKDINPNSSFAVHETQFLGMMRHLAIRGSSFLEHDTALIQALFSAHDSFFQRHNLPTTDQFLSICNDINEGVMDAIRARLKLMSKFKKLHEEFILLTGKNPELSLEEAMSQIRSSPLGVECRSQMQSTQSKGEYLEFEVTLPDPTGFLRDKLSLSVGENSGFLTFKKSPGWPSNDSQIFERPLIQKDGKLYCPNTILLMRNRAHILEGLIKEIDSKYYETKYVEVRGKTIEKLALGHLARLLPGAQILPNVYYSTIENGLVRRFESDGLILFDDVLFIVEMKAGPFSVAAMRGAEKTLKSDLSHLVGEPYTQATRTLRFIQDHHPARFEWEDMTEAITIESLDQFRSVYMVNVTLADIGHVSARLNSTKEMGLVDGRTWPWSVFINDLRVISELLESPTEFLLYLERRLALNALPQVSTIDELDYLAMFLNEGLHYRKEDLAGLHRFSPVGYTVSIDRYYNHLAGHVSSGEKPRLKISDWYRNLMSEIEATGAPRRFLVSTLLLSLDGTTQDEIEGFVQKFVAVTRTEGKEHSFTLAPEEASSLVVLVTSPTGAIDEAKIRRYTDIKRHQTGISSSVVLVFRASDSKLQGFLVDDAPVQPTAQLEQNVEQFAQRKYDAYLAEHGRSPSRNEQCPCASGKKFKKCCLGRGRAK